MHEIRNKEPLKVNKAHPEMTNKSTIPYLQRRSNSNIYMQKLVEVNRRKENKTDRGRRGC